MKTCMHEKSAKRPFKWGITSFFIEKSFNRPPPLTVNFFWNFKLAVSLSFKRAFEWGITCHMLYWKIFLTASCRLPLKNFEILNTLFYSVFYALSIELLKNICCHLKKNSTVDPAVNTWPKILKNNRCRPQYARNLCSKFEVNRWPLSKVIACTDRRTDGQTVTSFSILASQAQLRNK